MKTAKILLVLFFIFGSIYARNTDYEKQADLYYSGAKALKDRGRALKFINRAVENYKKAVKTAPSPEIISSYAGAVDFKYSYIAVTFASDSEKKAEFKKVIKEAEKYCAENPGCENEPGINYAAAIAWGRYGEIINGWEAATEGVADRIKKAAEKLLEADESYNNYIALATLGRMHYKAPNIVFVLTWPDKNKSKQYLERYLEKNPGSPTAILFFADTLKSLGEEKRALKLYKKAAFMEPRENEYFHDLGAIKEARKKYSLKFKAEN